MAEEIKSQAIRGVVWSMIDTYSGQIVGFVISIILARILTPSEYGLIGMLAIFMGISNTFIDGGFSSALIQKKDRTQADLSTVFYINVGMATLMYGILFFTAPLIAEFYNQPILESIVKIYCISLIINSFCSTSSVQLTIKLDFKTTTKISLIGSIISGICGIVMAYSGFGVWALVYQALIFGVLRIILLYSLVRWHPSLIFSRSSFKRLFAFSSKLFTATIISSVYDNLTGAVVGKQFSAAELGYYNRGEGYNIMVNGNVVSVLGRVSYPLLSKIQDEDERLKSIYQKYIQMSAFLTFPALMLLCGIAKPLILFMITDKWVDCVILLQILSFAYLFNGVVVSNLNLIKVKGRSDLVLKLELIKKAIAFIILGISIAMDSIIAICVGRAIYGCVFALYLNTYYTKKLLGYGFREQFKDFVPYLVLSLSVLIIGLVIAEIIDNPFGALVTAIPLCIFFYLFLCSKLKLYAYKETKTMIGPVFNRIKLMIIKNNARR